MSVIKTGTTTTTGYVVESDTNGNLVIQTGSTPTTALTLGDDQSATFAGSLINSAGTANGVLYLNGSKVLTSGSALAFDGTNLKTNSIVDASGGSTTTINGYTPTVSNMAGRNRIINGAMMIDQRNAGASVTINPSVDGNVFTLDRFRVGIFGSTYSSTAATVQQVTDAPIGFTNSLKVTSSSTITPDANKLGSFINQAIEGFNVADLAWGTASASSITITFIVKASKTGTVSVAIENATVDRSYLTTVSIASADTWETKTLTIPGDTSGTWGTNNGVGISLVIGLFSNGSWLAGTGGSWSSTRAILSTSQTNFLATSSDYFAITGVQLEKGTVATPFEHRLYGTELALCQRYYYRLGSQNFCQFGIGDVYSTTNAVVIINFPVSLRAAGGSLSVTNSGSTQLGGVTVTSVSPDIIGVNTASIVVGASTASFTAGQAKRWYDSGGGSSSISFSSEL